MAGGNLTDVYAVEIEDDLSAKGRPFRVCGREIFGEENERFADPFLYVEGDNWYLFGAIGPRLNQKIGLAKATR